MLSPYTFTQIPAQRDLPTTAKSEMVLLVRGAPYGLQRPFISHLKKPSQDRALWTRKLKS